MPSADFSAEGCIFSSFGSGSDAKARPDRKWVTDSTEVNLVVQRQSCPISDLHGGDTASYDLQRTASQNGNGSCQRTKAAGGA